MDTFVLTIVGVMGSWNVAVTIWMLRNRRNNLNNPHPPPCISHSETLARLERAIEAVSTEVKESYERLHQDLDDTKRTVTILWHDAYPGQSEPKA